MIDDETQTAANNRVCVASISISDVGVAPCACSIIGGRAMRVEPSNFI